MIEETGSLIGLADSFLAEASEIVSRTLGGYRATGDSASAAQEMRRALDKLGDAQSAIRDAADAGRDFIRTVR